MVRGRKTLEVRGASIVVRGTSAVVRGASRVVRFCFVIGILCGVLHAQEAVVDRMLAVVNGDVVTQSDVRAARRLLLMPFVASMTDDAVVTQLIERRLMLVEVARYAPAEPTADQLEAHRRAWTATLPAGTNLSAVQKSVGLRDPALAAWLRDDLRIAVYLDLRFTAAAQPTRDQALTYFKAHEADFAVAGTVPAFATVEADVRRRVAAERRTFRIREWIDGLKQRAEIRRIG